LENTVRQIAQAGAASVTPIVLHLRTGAREWFFRWLGETHPGLVPRYRALYGRGAYAPAAYQQQVTEQVKELARRHGVGRGAPGSGRPGRPPRFAPPAERRTDLQTATPQQLTLLWPAPGVAPRASTYRRAGQPAAGHGSRPPGRSPRPRRGPAGTPPPGW